MNSKFKSKLKDVFKQELQKYKLNEIKKRHRHFESDLERAKKFFRNFFSGF